LLFKFRPHCSGALAHAGHFVAHIRQVQHFLYIPQSIRPFPITLACNHPFFAVSVAAFASAASSGSITAAALLRLVAWGLLSWPWFSAQTSSLAGAALLGLIARPGLAWTPLRSAALARAICLRILSGLA
jgi:hypothetical protein